MKIGFDAKRYFHNRTGLGNYSRTLVEAVRQSPQITDTVLYDSPTLERTFRLGHKAVADGCDLYHGLSNELPRDIVGCGIPSVCTLHDVAWRTFPGMYTLIDRKIYDMKYGWSVRNATRVICISQSTKRDAMRFYGVPEERLQVIYQPVQATFYTPMDAITARAICERRLPYTQQREFVVTVGSINSRKNLLGIVKALETIAPDMRPLLVAVGNGRGYRQLVERYINEHGLRPYVRIETGIHDVETLQALYTTATCLLYPSFYEGFGLPVVEASLQQCPVITSNLSSLPEAGGPAAVLCDPTAASQMGNALYRLLTDKSECEQRGRAAHDYCMERFNPQKLTQEVIDLYQSLTGK